MTGAWLLPENKAVVLLFANVSDLPFTSHVVSDPREPTLPFATFTITTLAPDGTRGRPKISPTGQTEIELPPRSVLAWEITPPNGRKR
jgi:hypothetical protein